MSFIESVKTYMYSENEEINSNDNAVYDSSNWIGERSIAYYAQGITNSPTIKPKR